MSLNITVLTSRFIVCTTDRRLVFAKTGKIVSERSTKLTVFSCSDAVGLITYNGIGRFASESPSDWLLELDSRVHLSRMPLKDLLSRIREDADSRFKKIACADKRHTFVVAAFAGNVPVGSLISNYESLLKDGHDATANPHFETTVGTPTGPEPIAVLVTGATEDFDQKTGEAIKQKAKEGAAAVTIKQRCIKAIRDASYRRARIGKIGTSVLSGILDPTTRNCEVDLSVVGGTATIELPNSIGPSFSTKGGYVRKEGFLGPSGVTESECPNCGNPVPLGSKRCGICDQLLF